MKNLIITAVCLCLIFNFTENLSAQTIHPFPQKELNDLTAARLKQNNMQPVLKSISETPAQHSVFKTLQQLQVKNIFKNHSPTSIDTITIGGDTLIVGYTPNDTLRITGNWTHIGPIIVLNSGVLIFKHANATIVGDIYVAGHGKAFSDSSSIYLPQQYLYQRSIVVVQNGYLNFSNTVFNYGGFSHSFVVRDSANAFLTNITNNDYTTTGLNGHANLTINGNNLTGEFIIDDYVNLHLRHATNALLWHQFPDTAVINHSFPNGTTVNSYVFNKTTPGVSGIEYNVQVDTSYNIQWSLMPVNGSTVTISNSTVRAVGLWFMGADSCTVSGLVNNSNYSNFTAPLTDRNLQFINSSVQTWSLYPMQSSVVNLSGSIVGEIGTEGTSKLTGTGYVVDGSGGYCWSSDFSFLINSNTTVTSFVRSERNSFQIFAYCTESNGVPTAIGQSLLMVVQSMIPQNPVPYDASCVWFANISQPSSAYVDSTVSIVGSAFINKTAISPYMDFGSYRVWYQKSGDTVWTAINNPVFTKVDNNILASWNTHGLTAGAYVLRLDMRDNLTDTVDAIKGVNLLPEILLSDGETMSENKISIYPNPATDVLNISTGLKATIEISNIEGQILKSQNTNENTIPIDISDFSRGMYFVNIVTTERRVVEKFIKE